MDRYIILILTLFLCASCTTQNRDYTNPKLPIEDRVDNLLNKMTLEEKVAQMAQFVGLEHMKKAEQNLSAEELANNDAQGFYENLHSSEVAQMVREGKIGSFLHVTTIEEANHLQELAQESRLQIPLLIGIDAIHGNGLNRGATVYPSPISLASTWDTTLVKTIGRQTAKEMRAMGAQWTFSPNIEVARDPRWGRVGETFGEDPKLVSDFGVKLIQGLQGTDSDFTDNVIANAKHAIGGGESVNGLNAAPADISDHSLREVFLPPFKAAIEAGVYTAMASHNEINGVPAHANKWLLENLFREEYGFNGFVVSDWMDIERLKDLHRVAPTYKDAFRQTIEAGMDMHMHGPGFTPKVVELVEEGVISEERINKSARRILEAKFRLGLFEDPFVDEDQFENAIFTDQHQETALEAAHESIVLLKNDGLLPLGKNKYDNILVTGPNANNQSILGDWVLEQPEDNITTVFEGIRKVVPEANVEFLEYGHIKSKLSENKFEEARQKAAKADLTVAVVGENSLRYQYRWKTSGENRDASTVKLHGDQLRYIKELKKSGKPVVVVLVNGRPLGVEWISENVPALIEAWEPGAKGGQALAEILFGEVNPSGKLPITFPRNVGQIMQVYNHKPSQYFHHYVLDETGPLFHFGYGLSYTTFEYSDLSIADATLEKGDTLEVSVDITNTGNRKGQEIAQLYIQDKYASVTQPVKELKGYQRLTLEKGEAKTVTFTISYDDLGLFDRNLNYVVEPGEFSLMVGGSSRDEDLIQKTFNTK
ncbi:glycoside hydrolase family 3 N-terminal domain-containing protein [Halalkalibaculum roseum]|uniref:glycoside hydrolase family 3 N-terminal domain-containing protein n=1 Tax=Halalkalibaculum roseum TaxID=2709311 RepID=UPI003D15F69C